MKKLNKNAITGCKGEIIAVDYLQKNGYTVVDKNWRFGHKEVDIIAVDKNTLVIVEVKTRRSDSGLTYEDVLPHSKQQYLIEAAEAYMEEKKIETELRFDLIFIYLQNDSHKLDHILNAFNAEI